MEIEPEVIELLLPGYFSGTLSVSETSLVDIWRKKSEANEKLFNDSLLAWQSLPLLHTMEEFDSAAALRKVNSRIATKSPIKILPLFQRAAAILILPLLIYSGYLTWRSVSQTNDIQSRYITQTVKSANGTITHFKLSDGTEVWLNSGSALEFPTAFSSKIREVKLKGEAYFKVRRDPEKPFRVNSNLAIKVLGTSFNVLTYPDGNETEVTLVEGKVKLSTVSQGKDLGIMSPGQMAVFNKSHNKITFKEVDVTKYTSWMDGELIFKEDKMDEVVKRLSRWFSAEIIITDRLINSYVYTATIKKESLRQVMQLLELSAPITFKIEAPKRLANGKLSAQKVYLSKK